MLFYDHDGWILLNDGNEILRVRKNKFLQIVPDYKLPDNFNTRYFVPGNIHWISDGLTQKREPLDWAQGSEILSNISVFRAVGSISEPIDGSNLDWQSLENRLRESAPWARVFEASSKTLKMQRAFTLLCVTITVTHNINDLKLAIAECRSSLVGISGIGDFPEEELLFLARVFNDCGFDSSILNPND